MDSERELLELAAKAASIELVGFEESGTHFAALLAPSGYVRWNPLRDDGDAFRLAIRLGFDISAGKGWLGCKNGNPTVVLKNSKIEESKEGDLYAAMRRVVVRAAAKLGSEMP